MAKQRKSTRKKQGPANVWRKAFLKCYAKTGIILLSCKAAGVERTIVWRHRKKDPAFADQMRQARQDAADVLEREAWRRAVDGVREPVYQGGKKVGVVQKYSDTLLIFLMKGIRPKKYRDHHHVVANHGGSVEIKLDADARRSRIASIAATLRDRAGANGTGVHATAGGDPIASGFGGNGKHGPVEAVPPSADDKPSDNGNGRGH